jgi:hypothetical protein
MKIHIKANVGGNYTREQKTIVTAALARPLLIASHHTLYGSDIKPLRDRILLLC